MKILNTLDIAGYKVSLIDRGYGPRWECGCPEYLETTPRTARPRHKHGKIAAGVYPAIETIPGLLGWQVH